MIGKIFRPFSNDWKKFSVHFWETKLTTKQPANKTLRQFRLFPTILLRRQLKQLGTTLSRCAAQPGGACQRKGPSNCQLGGATFQSRPSEWDCGRGEKDKPDKGERPAGAVTSDEWQVGGAPCGRTIAGKTNRRTREAGGEREENSRGVAERRRRRGETVRQFRQFQTIFEETTQTTRDNYSKVPGGQLRPAEGREWDCGRGEKDKQDKGGQKCGRKTGGMVHVNSAKK